MSISAPQKQREPASGTWVGNLQPASHIAYFHSVIARSRRCSAKSASVIFGSISRHDRSNAARAFRKTTGSTAVANASIRHRIHRDRLLPLIRVNGHARAHTDRADINIVSENQPVFGLSILISAAG
jgi:hypothetical protein